MNALNHKSSKSNKSLLWGMGALIAGIAALGVWTASKGWSSDSVALVQPSVPTSFFLENDDTHTVAHLDRGIFGGSTVGVSTTFGDRPFHGQQMHFDFEVPGFDGFNEHAFGSGRHFEFDTEGRTFGGHFRSPHFTVDPFTHA